VLALALAPFVAFAQSEAGLILSAGVEKKINKKMSVELEANFRTRNDFKTLDRWSGGIGTDYKLTKWLKADVGYELLYDNNRENISYNYAANGAVTGYNNWRPSYWGQRHRFRASLTVDRKVWGNLRLSLRERWQYTYRPEKETERWDFDNSYWEIDARSGRGKNVLRSRLQAEYDQKGSIFKPYASAEIYNDWNIEKVRYLIGTDIKLSKQHSFDVFYRFQKMHNVDVDDYEPDMHYIGIGYKFKF
jgi:hypothetical protein